MTDADTNADVSFQTDTRGHIMVTGVPTPLPPPSPDPRKDRSKGQPPEATIVLELVGVKTSTGGFVECQFQSPQPEVEDSTVNTLGDLTKMGLPKEVANVFNQLVINATKAIKPTSPPISTVLIPLIVYKMINITVGDHVTILIRKNTDLD